MNDAPALSAAQVGIAVDGATDAAKNAADLILTEPGLSPIYGAVLESRRIFARIKGELSNVGLIFARGIKILTINISFLAYVIYRVAASMVLVLSLSIVIFVTGCSVDSLYIIILALLNDVSMIPVAYDNGKLEKLLFVLRYFNARILLLFQPRPPPSLNYPKLDLSCINHYSMALCKEVSLSCSSSRWTMTRICSKILTYIYALKVQRHFFGSNSCFAPS